MNRTAHIVAFAVFLLRLTQVYPGDVLLRWTTYAELLKTIDPRQARMLAPAMVAVGRGRWASRL